MVDDADLGYEYDVSSDRARFRQHYGLGSATYRMQKERFVTGSPGSTPTEVVFVCLIAATSVIMHQVVSRWFRTRSTRSRFCIEFICIPIVITIAMFYPEHSLQIWLAQVAAIIGIVIVRRRSVFALQEGPAMLPRSRLRFITWFRSAFMLCTCCCILAVDFPLFPRRSAKTESFGISVMDTGVGFVVFSSGIVSKQARPGPRPNLLTVIRSTLPVFIMGLVRLASVRAVDYQTHVSEYGVHWNFFFTLMSVSLVSYLAGPLVDRISAAAVAVFAAVVSQLLVSAHLGFLLDGDRHGWFSANREGIYSSLGYLALYFAGVEIGQRVGRAKSARCWWHLTAGLVATSAVCFAIVAMLGTGSVSRRFANLPFVAWIVALNTAMLSIELAFDLVSARDLDDGMIMTGVDRNQLVIFLIGNLMTGAVNLSTQTLYATDLNALLIMIFYLLLICTVAAALERYRISLKFW